MTQTEEIAQYRRINAFGKKLSVVRIEGEEYLIGVQIATLLKRETFNMYRSMKIKNIQIKRANPEHVEYLCNCNAVRTGTHSVTLIPYESGLYFVADAWYRQHKSEGFPYTKTCKHPRSFILDQPKLHRRKAHPWNVYRSIKRGDLDSPKQFSKNFVDLSEFSFEQTSSDDENRSNDINIESLLFAADSLDVATASSPDSSKEFNGLPFSFRSGYFSLGCY